MKERALKVEGISKAYRIGLREQLPDTLAGFVQNLVSSPWRNFQKLRRLTATADSSQGSDTLWALKDVSFDVNQGEVVGIIGRNGAGKSTLLKVLSRITEPTEGCAELHGRVSSLLEVGTGFHPELTGRENIYMNGTILGMSKTEIDKKFDEIVEFSGVGKFLDTPTKRYSSGMAVRLAFSVAASLEPEIMIIDEVLAVGDAAFQEKCMEKMKNVARSGRTVLFVSHNMGAVRNFCTRGIVLDSGRIGFDGPVDEAVVSYATQLKKRGMTNVADREDRSGLGEVKVVRCTVGEGEDMVFSGEPFRMELELSEAASPLVCVLSIFDADGTPVIDLRSRPKAGVDSMVVGNVISCQVDCLPLMPGKYRIDVEIWTGRTLQDLVEEVASFHVAAGNVDGRFIEARIRRASLTLPAAWGMPCAAD